MLARLSICDVSATTSLATGFANRVANRALQLGANFDQSAAAHRASGSTDRRMVIRGGCRVGRSCVVRGHVWVAGFRLDCPAAEGCQQEGVSRQRAMPSKGGQAAEPSNVCPLNREFCQVNRPSQSPVGLGIVDSRTGERYRIEGGA